MDAAWFKLRLEFVSLQSFLPMPSQDSLSPPTLHTLFTGYVQAYGVFSSIDGDSGDAWGPSQTRVTSCSSGLPGESWPCSDSCSNPSWMRWWWKESRTEESLREMPAPPSLPGSLSAPVASQTWMREGDKPSVQLVRVGAGFPTSVSQGRAVFRVNSGNVPTVHSKTWPKWCGDSGLLRNSVLARQGCPSVTMAIRRLGWETAMIVRLSQWVLSQPRPHSAL